MNFTLRELEAFVRVARAGSFSRGARALNMSQPALTVRIRHLEEALGVRLIDRTTRSVSLTQVGRECLPAIERVLGEIGEVAANVGDLAGRRRGLVTVAALPSVASAVLPATIAAFRADHPGITVRLRDGVAQRVTDLVKSGEADFGIGSPTRGDRDLRISALTSDPVGVVFRPGDPLDRRGPVRIEDVLTVPLILLDPQYSVRLLVDRAFESIGKSVAPAFEVSYVPTALGLVNAGLGVAILALSAHESVPLGRLRARPIVHPLLVRHICLIESAQRSLSPAAHQFVAAVHATCRRWRPGRLAAEPSAPAEGSRGSADLAISASRTGRRPAVNARRHPT